MDRLFHFSKVYSYLKLSPSMIILVTAPLHLIYHNHLCLLNKKIKV